MFRIAEEPYQDNKQNPDEKYCFILEKFDFQIFKNIVFSKIENLRKKSENRNLWEIEHFKIISKMLMFFKFRFFRFFLNILIFENFENFEILKINFLQDEKICFIRFYFIILIYSSAIPNIHLELP